jgi:hypothetical protein
MLQESWCSFRHASHIVFPHLLHIFSGPTKGRPHNPQYEPDSKITPISRFLDSNE